LTKKLTGTRSPRVSRAYPCHPVSALAAAWVVILGACDAKPSAHQQAVIVLGFDGMDPRLTEQMMDEGRLPNFARLRDQGSFKPLQSVTPPQSPVAWATFATGLNPGGHGLFDFIHRDPAPPDMKSGVKPYSAMSRTVPEESWLASALSWVFGDSIGWGDYDIPLRSSRHELLRHGTPFWEHITRAGVPAWVYRLPANFPADGPSEGSLFALTDMGTPDLSDTLGEFSFYTNDPEFDFNRPITGGKAYAVQVIDGMVLPARTVASGTVKSMVSPTEFVFQGWTRLERRLDGYAGCVAVFSRGTEPGECMRAVTSVDVESRRITLEAAPDVELKPGLLIKLYTRCKFNGPPNPAVRKASATASTPRAQTDFTVYIDPDPAAAIACIEFGDQKAILRQGEWSGWYPVEFPIAYGRFMGTVLPPAKGMCRFYLKQLRPHVALYVSPFNYDPLDPVIPISFPKGFSAAVAEVTGRYYTQGLPENTKALTHHVLTRDEFLQQADIVADERDRLLTYALNHFGGGFLFFYYGGTDLVAHMFWAMRDPEHPGVTPKDREKYLHAVEDYYIRADRMLGRTLDRHSEALVLVVSDHGFESFAKGFNLNTWLAQNGYAVQARPGDPAMPLNFDFTRTRAYGLGLNGLYVNLKGRERDGIVEPADRQSLLDEITRGLLRATDPVTGRKVVKEVYRGDSIYKGPYVAIAPDLQVGYWRGYRASWETILGSFPEKLVEDNLDAWGADHCIATDEVPGVILSNRPIAVESPGLIDLAPTVLRALGLAVPAEMEGRSIFP